MTAGHPCALSAVRELVKPFAQAWPEERGEPVLNEVDDQALTCSCRKDLSLTFFACLSRKQPLCANHHGLDLS